jgi:flagellar hook-associated protein 1
MSGLYASLNLSVKALNAHSKAIETAGRNLSNVNNPNYARQRVVFGDRGTVQTVMGPQSLGIEALGLQQMRDALLDMQLARESGLLSQLSTNQLGLQKAQAALGQSIDRANGTASADGGSQGLAESLTQFFNAFQSLAAKPTDFGERQTLLQRAEILGDRFRLTDSRLAQVQSDLTTLIGTDTRSANDLLSSIASLNLEISRFEVTAPGGAVDLRDMRMEKIDALAKKMGFETRDQAGSPGQIQVYTKDSLGNEVILVDHALSATLTASVSGTGTSLVTASNIPGAAVGATATLTISSGSIKGSMEAWDTVQTLREDIDLLAEQLVTSVNDAYNPLGTGRDFFVATGTSAASIRRNSSVTASNLEPDLTTGGAAGNTTIPLAVAAVANHSFSTTGLPPDLINGTLSQHFNKTVTGLGQTLNSVASRLDDQDSITQLVRNQRDAISGVSLDEEMADLMKYQRSFQASSKVISILDDLLDVIVNRLGA